MSIAVKCECGKNATVNKIMDTGHIVVDQCNACVLAAYALGYADKTASSAEKTTAAAVKAAWGIDSI